MSNPNVQQAEPTMEEILASIRRIISEEGPDQKAPEAVAVVEEEPVEDILELTEMVVEEAPAPIMAAVVMPEPEPEYQPAPVFRAVAPAPAPPAPAPRVAVDESDIVLVDNDMTRPEDDGLLAGHALDRVGSAFSQLDRGLSISSSSDGRTIEDMIREMLKPMLKNWLDEHLPEMVERVVREEVERVARRGRR